MKQKVSNLFNKYLTQKLRNIISIFIIIFGLIYIIDYSFYKPTYINKYIATNIYKDSSAGSFVDSDLYFCALDAYNSEQGTSLPYTTILTNAQLATIKEVSCNYVNNANGLSVLTNLQKLILGEGTTLKTLDLSSNVNLSELSITDSSISNSISLPSNLNQLSLSGDVLPNLDLTVSRNLERFILRNSIISGLDITNVNLKYIEIHSSKLTNLDVSTNTRLRTLEIEDNYTFSSITFGNNPALDNVSIVHGSLANVDVSKLANLKFLNLRRNNLKSIDVSDNSLLETLNVADNRLGSINVETNTHLKYLDISNEYENNTILNHITELDLSNNENLNTLYAGYNDLSSLNIAANAPLLILYVNNNKLESIDLSSYDDLVSLMLLGNPFKVVKAEYVGSDIMPVSAVKLPSQFSDSKINWTSSDANIAAINDDGKIVGTTAGSVLVVGTCSYFSTTMELDFYNVSTTNEDYRISPAGEYIFIGKSVNKALLLNELKVPDFYRDIISLEMSSDGNAVILVKNGITIKEMEIVTIDPKNNSIIKAMDHDYIYSGGTRLTDSNLFTCNNCTASVSGNYLIVKYNDIEIYKYKLVRVSSNSYTLYYSDGEYIYVGNDNDSTIRSKMTVINGKSEIGFDDDDKNWYYYVKYGNISRPIAKIKLKKIKLNKDYILGDDYIFTGFDNLIEEINNGETSVPGIELLNNNLLIKIENGKLLIGDRSKPSGYLGEYSIIRLSNTDDSISYDEAASKIFVESGLTVSQFKSKIKALGTGIKTRIYNGNNEVTSGNINNGMRYVIYYNNDYDHPIRTYLIDAASYIVKFPDDYDVKDNYIFITGDNDIDLSRINTVNCALNLNQGRLEVKQDDEIIEYYDIVKITGNYKYLENGSIYVGGATNGAILKNVKVPNTLKKEISSNGYTLNIKVAANGKTLFSKELIRLEKTANSNYEIDEERKLIYLGTADSFVPSIDGNLTINGNINMEIRKVNNIDTLVVDLPDDDIEYKLYGYYPSWYDITNKYLYIGYSSVANYEVGVNIINGFNVSIEPDNDSSKKKMLVRHNADSDNLIFELDILYFYFDNIPLIKPFINNGLTIDSSVLYFSSFTDFEILNNIKFSNDKMSASIKDNKLIIKYNNSKIAEVKMVRLNGTYYDCVNSVVFTNGNDFYPDHISLENASITPDMSVFKVYNDSDKTLNIKYGTGVLDENAILLESFMIVNEIALNTPIIIDEDDPLYNKNITIARDTLVVTGEILVNDFNSFVNKNDGLVWKFYNGSERDTEVTSGNIQSNMELAILRDNVEVMTFKVSNEFLRYSSSVIEDHRPKIIYGISPGSSVQDVYNTIFTSGEVSAYYVDGDERIKINTIDTILKTGYEIDVQLFNNLVTHKISVLGDIYGTGTLSVDSAKKIAGNIIRGIDFENELFYAADYNGDGYVKVNDVVKILREMEQNNS